MHEYISMHENVVFAPEVNFSLEIGLHYLIHDILLRPFGLNVHFHAWKLHFHAGYFHATIVSCMKLFVREPYTNDMNMESGSFSWIF